ncbi:MAG: zinc-dependent alcohol dehydrogenase family protein [Candidatus Riflebacteria bacterium]|nr:zinc-dependent alcohol dehydrogenase family protein [Candidatus Riflebacteria bacterium]
MAAPARGPCPPETTTRATTLERPHEPLKLADLPRPTPGPGELLVRVEACGVCRTDLHLADGEVPAPRLPLVLGHEIVGVVDGAGPGAGRFSIGRRVGIPWLGTTCGACDDCGQGRENLCGSARFTGRDIDGGYAEYTVVDERYCFPVPDRYSAPEAAPLLCAGLIGYRSFRKAGQARRLGLYGFGAAAHLVAQVARHEGREVFAFTRPGDVARQRFALELGAAWAGGSDDATPAPLDAAILFAPVGSLVPTALKSVRPGGTVVCAGIHMSDIPSFPYALLWGERTVVSVANLTRRDGDEFMELASRVRLRTEVSTFRLDEANEAMDSVRRGRLQGAAVLVPGERQHPARGLVGRSVGVE